MDCIEDVHFFMRNVCVIFVDDETFCNVMFNMDRIDDETFCNLTFSMDCIDDETFCNVNVRYGLY